MRNIGTSIGRMPVNVFVTARARVTAGFANEVDDVNQYAAVIYAPTANGTTADRCREQLQITASRPNVATNSLSASGKPARTCSDTEKIGSPNIRSAIATPTN